MTITETSDRTIPADERLERSHRVPLVATCVFVVMMLAIWLMGRQVRTYSAEALIGDAVEEIRAD